MTDTISPQQTPLRSLDLLLLSRSIFLTDYPPSPSSQHRPQHYQQPLKPLCAMDRPFRAANWKPTNPWGPSDIVYGQDQVETLITQLNTNSVAILRHPYDPNLWLDRARTLTSLRYPELAVGDSHKCILLCEQIMDSLHRRPRQRMGQCWGFHMLDEQEADDPGQSNEREWQYDRLFDLNREAHSVQEANLYYATTEFTYYKEGRYVPQQYPWMREEHLSRSDELVRLMNLELLDAGKADGRVPACDVRQYAFGRGVRAGDGRDLLGVFATRDVTKGATILVDTSRAFGCNGPGRDGNTDNLSGGVGCMEEFHPNTEEDTTDQDLRWVRDRCGVKAANVLLLCRFLLCGVSDQVRHPLDHSLVARLTPTYRDKWREFSLENDIVIPNKALQQFGIDIFGNPNYADSYVLFVMIARIDNNSWSDPNTSGVNSLFSLINHSCEPNARWGSQKSHITLKVTACRDIVKDEQIFIEYDAFMNTSPLEKRRSRLRKWLDCPCQCTRCVREEAEASRSSPISSDPGWDCDKRPVLPEDYERPCRIDSDSD